MKWTTANVKSPNYTVNHEIFVGTQTGSFKRLTPAYEDNPYVQRNLQEVRQLEKESRITSLSFGNAEHSEILVGRAHNTAELYSLRSEKVERSVQLRGSPVVGLARYGDEQLVAGFGTGQVEQLSLSENKKSNTDEPLVTAGDDMMHLRQCAAQRNLVATGGKGRQNNLKVFDMEAGGKQVFSSKNLPNDYLQLEVPVWDSDVGFIDTPHTLATCSRHGYVRVYDTRKQRRPVQCYATEDQMSFATLAAQGNYIYTGTTMGVMKAFDIRRMNTFAHTYKGFTGGITDLHLDSTGKYLSSACLDRYVRVHHADSCVLLYQCYVKSKATRVLMRDSMENPNSQAAAGEAEIDDDDEEQQLRRKKQDSKTAPKVDKEYDDMFENMPTVCENAEEVVDPAEEEKDEETESSVKTKSAAKRKNKTKAATNKKKKN